ncbi:MAG: hypothetical protein RL154_273 [Pseudomonadota bacterium]|jgi:cytochrome b
MLAIKMQMLDIMTTDKYTLASRFLHFGLALFLFAAYFSSEHTEFYLHLIFGLLFFVFVLTKTIWLFSAPDLANIKKFNFGNTQAFLKDNLNHNPLSSIVSILILTFGIFTAISGIETLYINEYLFIGEKVLKEIHEICANITLFLAIFHIIGVLADKFIFCGNTYKKMLNFKVDFSLRYIIAICGLSLFSVASYFLYNFFTQTKPIEKNSLYITECSSCHFAYPASLYNTASWTNIMDNLDYHYGDNAAIEDDPKRLEILAYLIKNSKTVEKTNIQFANFTTNGKNESITKTREFERLHRHMPKDTKFASCDKCHTDAESGYFRLANIRIKNDENNTNRR